MTQELTLVRPVVPESTETSVQVNICLHQVILALEELSQRYPVERMSWEQVDRIIAATNVMRKRLEKENMLKFKEVDWCNVSN